MLLCAVGYCAVFVSPLSAVVRRSVARWLCYVFFFSSRRRHTRLVSDWSSDVCSSDLFEDEKVDTIECESAEAALAVMLIGGREIAMVFADVRLPGAMGGVDLAWEVKLRWPLLPMILTSGHPLERIRELPPGVAYMPKPWQPLNVLIAAEQAVDRLLR